MSENLPNPGELSDQCMADNLAQAESIKQNMAQLLRELETKATGKLVNKHGSWRHYTSDWVEQNPEQKPTSN